MGNSDSKDGVIDAKGQKMTNRGVIDAKGQKMTIRTVEKLVKRIDDEGKQKITVLNLRDTDMDDALVLALFIRPKSYNFNSLEKLDLSRNRMTSCGMDTVAAALPSMTSLKSLIVNDNNGVSDWSSLNDAVVAHPTLNEFVTSPRNAIIVKKMQKEKRDDMNVRMNDERNYDDMSHFLKTNPKIARRIYEY